nr:UTRA domain-containing protein [Aerococcus viridans]
MSNKRVAAPDFLVGEDGVEADEPFIHLIRAREMEGETVIVDHDYLRVSVVQDGYQMKLRKYLFINTLNKNWTYKYPLPIRKLWPKRRMI